MFYMFLSWSGLFLSQIYVIGYCIFKAIEMDCLPVPIFPQNTIQLHIQEIFRFDGKEK